MSKREGLVTLQGNSVTLVGNELKEGDPAPDFRVVANDMNEKTLADYKGKVLVISSVPSLDTPVCDMETQRFNNEAASLGDDVKILTISMDLPFAQKRWCGANGVNEVETLSDHREASFGQAYGVLIEGMRLLARAVFVIDREGTIKYVELVKEIADEPDYDRVIGEIQKLT